MNFALKRRDGIMGVLLICAVVDILVIAGAVLAVVFLAKSKAVRVAIMAA